jgi:hypothetical protein
MIGESQVTTPESQVNHSTATVSLGQSIGKNLEDGSQFLRPGSSISNNSTSSSSSQISSISTSTILTSNSSDVIIEHCNETIKVSTVNDTTVTLVDSATVIAQNSSDGIRQDSVTSSSSQDRNRFLLKDKSLKVNIQLQSHYYFTLL